MKPALLKKYWATWRDVKDRLMTQRELSSAMADAMRDELCCQAHGRAISAAEMTDDEAGDVLKEFALVLRPDDIGAQMEDNSEAGRKRRQCIWSIQKEEKFPGYAMGICQDIYHRRDWKDLPLADLLTLRRRIGNDYRRAGAPHRAGKAAEMAEGNPF